MWRQKFQEYPTAPKKTRHILRICILTGADAQNRCGQLDRFCAKSHMAVNCGKGDYPIAIQQICALFQQAATREVYMPQEPEQHRPNPKETRKLLAHLIKAREQYSIFLREVATGQRQPDSAEKALLKMQCDETLGAWRAVHEAWRRDSSHGRTSLLI